MAGRAAATVSSLLREKACQKAGAARPPAAARGREITINIEKSEAEGAERCGGPSSRAGASSVYSQPFGLCEVRGIFQDVCGHSKQAQSQPLTCLPS